MLDIFELRLKKVLDLLRSGRLGRMLLAEDFGDIGRATAVPCKDLEKESADLDGIFVAIALSTYVFSVTGNVGETAHSSNRHQAPFELFRGNVCNSECRVF